MQGKKGRAKPACGAETRTCHCGHHLKEHEPKRGKCRLCDCQGFRGRPCTDTKLKAGGRCHRHGGATPTGLASPNWKNGRWSQYLPVGVLAKFQEGLADPDLMKLRQDTALIDAALTDYTERLKTRNRPLTNGQRVHLAFLTDQRRKLIESDARRQKDLQQTVPIERVMQLVAALADVVREFVDRDKLPKAQARLQQLLIGQGSQVINVPNGGTE